MAPQQELYELARAYVAQQRDFGNSEGQVVRTLDDAYLALDLKQPDFHPVLTVIDNLDNASPHGAPPAIYSAACLCAVVSRASASFA